MDSKILSDVMSNKNRTVNLKVVFVDIVSYSKRRSITQADVIDGFMEILKASLSEISQNYVKYAQDNNLNFQHDIVSLSSGDGAAIIFPFDGLHDIHLEFAKEILKKIHANNKTNNCEKFKNNGWCNCHNSFNLTLGISEGKGIIYKDINNNYNVAGNVINMAARVMRESEKNQILLSEEAYTQIIDLVDDPHLDEKFVLFSDVKIKHGLKVNLYQYCDESEYINSESPEDLIKAQKARHLLNNMRSAGFPIPDLDSAFDDDSKIEELFEQMSDMFSGSTSEGAGVNLGLDHKKL